MQHEADVKKLGQAGKDQYEYEIGQGKSSQEALKIAKFADRLALQRFMDNGFREVPLFGANTSSSVTAGSVDSRLANDQLSQLAALGPAQIVGPTTEVTDATSVLEGTVVDGMNRGLAPMGPDQVMTDAAVDVPQGGMRQITLPGGGGLLSMAGALPMTITIDASGRPVMPVVPTDGGVCYDIRSPEYLQQLRQRAAFSSDAADRMSAGLELAAAQLPEEKYRGLPEMSAVHSRSPNDVESLLAVEGAASTAGHGLVAAEQGALFVAKHGAHEILERASPLHRLKQVGVAGAAELNDAIGLFRSPDGQSVKALAVAELKYGNGLTALGWAGTAVSSLEEGVYVVRTYEATNSPETTLLAGGAALTNLSGDTVATVGGMKLGALVGVPLAEFSFGLSIPIGAVIGGFAGHYTYDNGVKPIVRRGWTGIKEPKP